ncbi:hypothetical protein, partial [Georgenia wangjunii]|uniref:hypothetical protein n=1 Tax=Georgenia wangjunii TaxID=3117730 RepID=UPI003D9C06C1
MSLEAARAGAGAGRGAAEGGGAVGDGDDAGDGAGVWGQLLGRIETALDHTRLVGVEPATLEDGSPVPFGLFAQL